MTPLWTPGSKTEAAAGGLQIVLPRERKRVLRCESCKAKYDLDDRARFERHVVHCAKVHEGEWEAGMAEVHDDDLRHLKDFEKKAYIKKEAAFKGITGRGISKPGEYS